MIGTLEKEQSATTRTDRIFVVVVMVIVVQMEGAVKVSVSFSDCAIQEPFCYKSTDL